ncbi:2-oxoglutarate dehydrogenase complex dihydrolipoyllysine-residue succinyltransferase [bacterium]|nr:2-oxoglutarate dehydrogenase complex dihydrolipoyllysine-residue succinyltransferase [bacterium]
MKADITVPAVGESITEGFIVEWHVADGDTVEADQPLFELETDKITMTIAAEQAGKVSISVGEDSKVEVGQVVGNIDSDGAGSSAPAPAEEKAESAPEPKVEEEAPTAEQDSGNGQVNESALEELAPAARRLVLENQLDPTKIEGSGKGGRILKEDVMRFMESGPAVEEKAAPAPKPQAEAKPAAAKPAPKPAAPRDPAERQTRKPMSTIRKRIAERLVSAKQDTAMLTTFNEVDMTNLMAMRAKYKETYQKKYGVKLGVMSFFVKAVVDALKTIPEVNRMIDGEDLIENHYYDIGIAVSTERGLMVPVLRDADQKSFSEIELEIGDFAKRARDGKIKLDELQGGVFTITNGGVFGSLLSTPILNPPQSAILGMHGIKKRPIVVEKDGEDTLEIRQMMYLAMSYDHRVIDGRESVTFLKRIMECIEDPERMMFEV